MDHLEMVEKLAQKAGVSYEDAKMALEACGWDMLDALVYLEKLGKTGYGAAWYSTDGPEPDGTVFEDVRAMRQVLWFHRTADREGQSELLGCDA